MPLRFPFVPLLEIPTHSKHSKIVYEILGDLKILHESDALKIDLAEEGKKKAHLRAALHRAAKKDRVDLATASDDKYLYVFRRKPKTQVTLHGAWPAKNSC